MIFKNYINVRFILHIGEKRTVEQLRGRFSCLFQAGRGKPGIHLRHIQSQWFIIRTQGSKSTADGTVEPC